jgi:hypothetical protein
MLVQRCGILGFPGNNFENAKKKIILVIIGNKHASGGIEPETRPVMLPYQYFSIFLVTGCQRKNSASIVSPKPSKQTDEHTQKS